MKDENSLQACLQFEGRFAEPEHASLLNAIPYLYQLESNVDDPQINKLAGQLLKLVKIRVGDV